MSQLPGDRASAVPLQLPQMLPVGQINKTKKKTMPQSISASELIAIIAILCSFLTATTVSALTAFFARSNLKLQLAASSRIEFERRFDADLHKALSEFNSITYEYITSIRDVRRDVGASPQERVFAKVTMESISEKLEAASRLSRRLEARGLDILLLIGPSEVTNAAAGVSVALSDLYNSVVTNLDARHQNWAGYELYWTAAMNQHRTFQEFARGFIHRGPVKLLNP